MKIFRKNRKELVSRKSVGKYTLYAIGEIFLVVVGILIALQIDNNNAEKKERFLEIEIIKGIKDDIIADKEDLNFNVLAYKKLIVRAESVLDYLVRKKSIDSLFTQNLYQLSNVDYMITLRTSNFHQAKERGLSIIKDKNLRNSISQLYEYRYESLKDIENDHKLFEHYLQLNQEVRKYLLYNDEGVNISPKSYKSLLGDQNFHYILYDKIKIQKTLVDVIYKYTIKECDKVLTLIENELSNRN